MRRLIILLMSSILLLGSCEYKGKQFPTSEEIEAAIARGVDPNTIDFLGYTNYHFSYNEYEKLLITDTAFVRKSLEDGITVTFAVRGLMAVTIGHETTMHEITNVKTIVVDDKYLVRSFFSNKGVIRMAWSPGDHIDCMVLQDSVLYQKIRNN